MNTLPPPLSETHNFKDSHKPPPHSIIPPIPTSNMHLSGPLDQSFKEFCPHPNPFCTWPISPLLSFPFCIHCGSLPGFVYSLSLYFSFCLIPSFFLTHTLRHPLLPITQFLFCFVIFSWRVLRRKRKLKKRGRRE